MNNTTINLMLVGVILVCALVGPILMILSNFKSKDPNAKFSRSKFWTGVVFSSIGSITIIVLMVRTGIDLSSTTITRTRVPGVLKVAPGINPW